MRVCVCVGVCLLRFPFIQMKFAYRQHIYYVYVCMQFCVLLYTIYTLGYAGSLILGLVPNASRTRTHYTQYNQLCVCVCQSVCECVLSYVFSLDFRFTPTSLAMFSVFVFSSFSFSYFFLLGICFSDLESQEKNQNTLSKFTKTKMNVSQSYVCNCK